LIGIVVNANVLGVGRVNLALRPIVWFAALPSQSATGDTSESAGENEIKNQPQLMRDRKQAERD
jgi:hypothetical protein